MNGTYVYQRYLMNCFISVNTVCMGVLFSWFLHKRIILCCIVVIIEWCETESCQCYFLPLTCLSTNHIEQPLLKAIVDVVVFAFSSFSIRTWKLSVRSLILAAVCITIAVIWGVYRNEDRYCQGTQAHNLIPVCLNFNLRHGCYRGPFSVVKQEVVTG